MHIHRRAFLSAAAAGATSFAWAQDPRLNALVEGSLPDSAAPGLIAAIIGPNGVQRLGFAGVRALGSPDHITAQDRWHIGSNGKAMTAVLYARLVEAGAAHWDAPLPLLLPDTQMDSAWSGVTIDQLLSHTAGISDRAVLGPAFIMAARADTRPLKQQRLDLARAVLEKPPVGVPGQMTYSSIGYALAGAAVERITGSSWEDAMRRFVFAPLGMDSAGFGAPEGHQPRGHRRPPPDFATLSPVPPGAMADNAAVTRPAGGVHLSMQDYGTFLAIFLGGRPGFLSNGSLERLARPRSAGERPYALGWGLRDDEAWARGPLLVHDGSNTLWHAAAQVAPVRSLALAAFANAGPKPELVLAPPQPGDAPGARRYVGSPSASPGPARALLEKLKPLVV